MSSVRDSFSLSLPALEAANKIYGHFHSHLIHGDALYDEISKSIERASRQQVDLHQASSVESSVTPFATSFLDLFDAEFTRVTNYITSQQLNQELAAKALMTNAEVLLANAASKSKNSAADASKAVTYKVEDQIDACIKLERFVRRNAEILTSIAEHADSDLNTSCTMMLKRKLLASPWKNGPSSSLVVLLSDIYDTIRAIEAEDHEKDVKWDAPSTFERSTNKYWVQDDRLTELLLAAVQEIPLLVYGRKGNLTTKAELLSSRSSDGDKLWDSLATPISSVYFDSPAMDLYKERIARNEGAQLLRVRWYGSRPSGDEPVFLELKTHHEKWINTKSVKERVTIREKDMIAFLSREKWTPIVAQDLVLVASPSLSGTKLENQADLLMRMHKLVIKYDLRPCVRSTYLRVAFQSSNTNALRLTVDRNVTLIDERSTPPGSWCLSDNAVISTCMIAKVPFSVFEIKLAGRKMPGSMLDLVENGVVLEAAKFSKFLTGAAAFCKARVETLPYWADHPSFTPVFGTPVARTEKVDGSSTPPARASMSKTVRRSYRSSWTKTIRRGSNVSSRTISGDSMKSSVEILPNGLPSTPENEMSVLHVEDKKDMSGKQYVTWLPFARRRSQTATIAPQRPARVEPKSYFANERTYIQWVSASLLLVTIAVLILEFPEQYSQAVPMGFFLIGCATFVMLYSIFVYFRRLRLLSSGKSFGYVDRVGPLMMGLAVLCGVGVLLFYFTGASKSELPAILTARNQECYQHSLNVSALEYQPSDIVVDTNRDLLLVPSTSKITAIERGSSGNNGMKVVAELPGADLEAITFAGDRMFVLAEEDVGSQLIELHWNSEDRLGITQQWAIASPMAEGIAYDPIGDRLFVASDNFNSPNDLPEGRGRIHVYDLPARANSTLSLKPKERLNGNLMNDGLVDSKIGSIVYLDGLLFVLHDNAVLVRAWDLATGTLDAEWELPRVQSANKIVSKQWEGMFLERVVNERATNENQLRGTGASSRGEYPANAELVLHLALDSPAQVWSLAVSQDKEQPGRIQLPSCAI